MRKFENINDSIYSKKLNSSKINTPQKFDHHNEYQGDKRYFGGGVKKSPKNNFSKILDINFDQDSKKIMKIHDKVNSISKREGNNDRSNVSSKPFNKTPSINKVENYKKVSPFKFDDTPNRIRKNIKIELDLDQGLNSSRRRSNNKRSRKRRPNSFKKSLVQTNDLKSKIDFSGLEIDGLYHNNPLGLKSSKHKYHNSQNQIVDSSIVLSPKIRSPAKNSSNIARRNKGLKTVNQLRNIETINLDFKAQVNEEGFDNSQVKLYESEKRKSGLKDKRISTVKKRLKSSRSRSPRLRHNPSRVIDEPLFVRELENKRNSGSFLTDKSPKHRKRNSKNSSIIPFQDLTNLTTDSKSYRKKSNKSPKHKKTHQKNNQTKLNIQMDQSLLRRKQRSKSPKSRKKSNRINKENQSPLIKKISNRNVDGIYQPLKHPQESKQLEEPEDQVRYMDSQESIKYSCKEDTQNQNHDQPPTKNYDLNHTIFQDESQKSKQFQSPLRSLNTSSPDTYMEIDIKRALNLQDLTFISKIGDYLDRLDLYPLLQHNKDCDSFSFQGPNLPVDQLQVLQDILEQYCRYSSQVTLKLDKLCRTFRNNKISSIITTGLKLESWSLILIYVTIIRIKYLSGSTSGLLSRVSLLDSLLNTVKLNHILFVNFLKKISEKYYLDWKIEERTKNYKNLNLSCYRIGENTAYHCIELADSIEIL